RRRTGVCLLRDDGGGGRGSRRTGDHHRALPSSSDGRPSEHQPPEGLMLPLLQAAAASGHPLDGTAARWLWAVPLLPLAGFVLNGALSILPAYHAGPADPGLAHGDGHGAAHLETETPDTAGAHADDHH